MASDSTLSGVIVPIVTPVDAQDRVDEAAFRQQIDHLLQAGVHGLFVGGSAGEGPLLTTDQWQRMMEIAFDQVGGKIPVLGGTADTSTARVLDRLRRLREIGYSYLVIMPTFYTPSRTVDEQLRLFEACYQQAEGAQLVAYNLPSATGVELKMETMSQLCERGWVCAVKESSGNPDYFWNVLQIALQHQVTMLVGDETLIASGLLAGGSGIVPVCANFEPKTFVEAFNAAREGRSDDLQRLQARIMLIRERAPKGGDCWIAGVKYAVSRLGIGDGRPVSPLQPLNDQQRQAIEDIMEKSS